jgi:SAM-dependent methyltransferase
MVAGALGAVVDIPCKICGQSTHPAGTKIGKFLRQEFHFVMCKHCGFVAEIDPSTDFATLYDEDYYYGRGADPLVDYANELKYPDETIRLYEWRGILDLLRSQVGNTAGKTWLDYGCGAGGLVRYARTRGLDCVGYDTGGFTERARAAGVPILTKAELHSKQGQFDLITMIEVIEHVPDPLSVLKAVAMLLAPGGLMFLTTGNVEPQAKKFLKWSYVIPEIHVSYFTPLSLTIAYGKVGLKAVDGHFSSGWTDIIRFKILKNLGIKKRSWAESLLPWSLLSRLADGCYRVSAHPLALKS